MTASTLTPTVLRPPPFASSSGAADPLAASEAGFVFPEPLKPNTTMEAARSWLDRIGERIGRERMRVALVALVTATTAMFGSADALPLAVNGVLILGFAITALLLFAIPEGAKRLGGGAAMLALVLAGWAIIQAMPVPEGFAHAVWSVADEALGMHSAAFSINPTQTVSAVVPLLIPFAVFLATLALANDDDGALALLRMSAYAGGGLAAFAVFQFWLAPETLLVIEKVAYRDSLTAPFVNRNTAATYFGAVALVAAGFLGTALGGSAETRLRMGGGRVDPRLTFGTILFVALMAVALTNSRAGLFSVVAAFVVAVPAMVMFPPSNKVSRFADRAEGAPRRRFLIGIGAAVAVVAGAILIGGRSIWRLDVAGFADNRFCILPRVIDLARDNWLTGTGLGTFETAYVAYRDPSCGIYGAWDSAHNVYLDAFVTLGIIAVPAAVIVIATLAAVFLAGIRRRHRMRAFPIVGLALVVLVALHSLMDFSIEIAGFSAPFALMAAAAAAIALYRPRRGQAKGG